ncbi:MAG: nuclear transport factor 2 family protein [Janthinobacterium lividum]
MTEAQVRQLVTSYVEAYNRFDVAGMLSTLHEDVVFENISAGAITLKTRGKAEFEAQAEQAKNYFSQREQRIVNWQIMDDNLEIAIEYAGILAIDLPNGVKAGDTLRLQGKSIFRFADNKIISLTDIS